MRICSEAGCLRTVPDDVRFCDECAPEHRKDKPAGIERAETDKIHLQYMSPRWRAFRRLILALHPWCTVCGRESKVADHVAPARLVVRAFRLAKLFPMDEWAGFYLKENTTGLCHACHNKKTKTEGAEDWSAQIDMLITKYTRMKGE